MENADAIFPSVPGDLDKLFGGSLEPSCHHPSFWMPDGAKPFPIAGVAPNRPILDQLSNGAAIRIGIGACRWFDRGVHAQTSFKRRDCTQPGNKSVRVSIGPIASSRNFVKNQLFGCK